MKGHCQGKVSCGFKYSSVEYVYPLQVEAFPVEVWGPALCS